jgi:hypothetical protein
MMVLFSNPNSENTACRGRKYESGFESTSDARSSSTCQCKPQPGTKKLFPKNLLACVCTHTHTLVPKVLVLGYSYFFATCTTSTCSKSSLGWARFTPPTINIDTVTLRELDSSIFNWKCCIEKNVIKTRCYEIEISLCGYYSVASKILGYIFSAWVFRHNFQDTEQERERLAFKINMWYICRAIVQFQM